MPLAIWFGQAHGIALDFVPLIQVHRGEQHVSCNRSYFILHFFSSYHPARSRIVVRLSSISNLPSIYTSRSRLSAAVVKSSALMVSMLPLLFFMSAKRPFFERFERLVTGSL